MASQRKRDVSLIREASVNPPAGTFADSLLHHGWDGKLLGTPVRPLLPSLVGNKPSAECKPWRLPRISKCYERQKENDYKFISIPI